MARYSFYRDQRVVRERTKRRQEILHRNLGSSTNGDCLVREGSAVEMRDEHDLRASAREGFNAKTELLGFGVGFATPMCGLLRFNSARDLCSGPPLTRVTRSLRLFIEGHIGRRAPTDTARTTVIGDIKKN